MTDANPSHLTEEATKTLRVELKDAFSGYPYEWDNPTFKRVFSDPTNLDPALICLWDASKALRSAGVARKECVLEDLIGSGRISEMDDSTRRKEETWTRRNNKRGLQHVWVSGRWKSLVTVFHYLAKELGTTVRVTTYTSDEHIREHPPDFGKIWAQVRKMGEMSREILLATTRASQGQASNQPPSAAAQDGDGRGEGVPEAAGPLLRELIDLSREIFYQEIGPAGHTTGSGEEPHQ